MNMNMMYRFNPRTWIYVVIFILISLMMSAYQYGVSRSIKPAAVSMIELKQAENQVSPRYITVADPNTKTVSVIMVEVTNQTGDTRVLSVTPYDRVSK